MNDVQMGAWLVIAAYVISSLGAAVYAHRREGRFFLQEAGTPLLRSFGDWAPRHLRVLMLLRRAAVLAVGVLLMLDLYALLPWAMILKAHL